MIELSLEGYNLIHMQETLFCHTHKYFTNKNLHLEHSRDALFNVGKEVCT